MLFLEKGRTITMTGNTLLAASYDRLSVDCLMPLTDALSGVFTCAVFEKCTVTNQIFIIIKYIPLKAV